MVSPATTLALASPAARAMDATMRSRSEKASPSSRMNPAVSAAGRAPATSRSLTVPHTASSPMSPPGKNIGSTTKASVVMASRPLPASMRAASSSGAKASLCRCFAKTSRTRLAVINPPLPWPSKI